MNRIEEMGNKVEIEGKMKDILEVGKDANEKMASLKEETKSWQDFSLLNIFIKGGVIGAVIAAHYAASGGVVLMIISRSFVWLTIASVCLVILVSGAYSFVQLTFVAKKYDETMEHMNIIIKEANSIEHEFKGVNNISELLKSKHSMLISELTDYGNKYQRFVNIFLPRFLVVLLVFINFGFVLSLSLLTPSPTTTAPAPAAAVVVGPTPVPAVAPIVPPIPSIAQSPPPNVPAMFLISSAPVPMPMPMPAPSPKGSLSFGKSLSLIVVVVFFVGALYYVANGGEI